MVTDPNIVQSDRNSDPAVFLVGGLQAMVASHSEAQKHIADRQADTEGQRMTLEMKRLELQSAAHGTAMKMDFTIKLLAIGFLIVVVGFGLYTGNLSIATHALGAVAGGLAGFGLAKRANKS